MISAARRHTQIFFLGVRGPRVGFQVTLKPACFEEQLSVPAKAGYGVLPDAILLDIVSNGCQSPHNTLNDAGAASTMDYGSSMLLCFQGVPGQNQTGLVCVVCVLVSDTG